MKKFNLQFDKNICYQFYIKKYFIIYLLYLYITNIKYIKKVFIFYKIF